jgi:chorismate dehydratase
MTASAGRPPVALGAVGYLNAKPLVFGLDRSPRFALRFDVPSRCAALLHEGAIDVGMIPSIEYLRGPAGDLGRYRIVPGLAIASRGPVASVALYTKRPIADVRSIAMDTSSRTSVALVRVLCARLFKIRPSIEARGPDLEGMLAASDAALLIGDNALLADHTTVRLESDARGVGTVEKIDLGEAWTAMTGLPFVYAFWAGRPGTLTRDDVGALQEARDAGVRQPEAIARAYFRDAPGRQAIGARYLRDNISYELGDAERAGLELFYRFAADIGVVPDAGALRFF